MNLSGPIIFFDGVCGLCNHSVDWVITHDQRGQFFFAPLQGETAKKMLPDKFTNDLSTIVLYYEGKIYTKSDAIILITTKLQGPIKIFTLLKFVPVIIRNFFYDLVAKFRYRLFGKKQTCRLPLAHEKKFFLP